MKDTLANPIIHDDKKKQVLSTIAREAGFTESTLSFLSLLVDARRIDAIDEIVEAFETKYCVLTDTQVRCIQICGSHRFLCTGYDAVQRALALHSNNLPAQLWRTFVR